MIFRQFIMITVFSALLGAAFAKLMVGPAPAKNYVIDTYQKASIWPAPMICHKKYNSCR